MTRLYIPRALSVGFLLVGAAWLAVAVRGLVLRLDLVGELPTRTVASGLLSTGLNLAIAVTLLAVGCRWLSYAVELDADGLRARLLWRRHDVPLADLKGVVLKQSGSTPQLRVVRRDGDVLVLPGWSLRAVADDGEVEEAGAALERLGLDLGFKVKRLTLTTQKPGP